MLILAATWSSTAGCMQGNNFSCPVPQDMAYLNLTCEDKPPAVNSQPSGIESASSVPNPSTFQTGNATVENASSQQCVLCRALLLSLSDPGALIMTHPKW